MTQAMNLANFANSLDSSGGVPPSRLNAPVSLVTQVTGTLPFANGGTGGTTAAALTILVGNLLFPVGSIYSSTVSTNPGTSLGFGTWTAFGAGRVLMGSGNASYLAGTTGGSADAITVSHTHTATVTDPGHLHSFTTYFNGSSNHTQYGSDTSQPIPAGVSQNTNSATTGITVANSTTGASGTNANLQPYVVVYMWTRTA